MTTGTFRRRTVALPLIALLLLVMALTRPAFATLGENVATVQSDQAHMRANIRMTRTTAYTTHELQSPNGTVVREFVSPAGMVFGVSWQGQSLPDLRQVLGKYFDQYVQGMQKRAGHGPRIIQEQGLVVQVAGHQRSLSGRAYLPEMLPTGVRAEEVR
jgi:hypothetical protein